MHENSVVVEGLGALQEPPDLGSCALREKGQEAGGKLSSVSTKYRIHLCEEGVSKMSLLLFTPGTCNWVLQSRTHSGSTPSPDDQGVVCRILVFFLLPFANPSTLGSCKMTLPITSKIRDDPPHNMKGTPPCTISSNQQGGLPVCWGALGSSLPPPTDALQFIQFLLH